MPDVVLITGRTREADTATTAGLTSDASALAEALEGQGATVRASGWQELDLDPAGVAAVVVLAAAVDDSTRDAFVEWASQTGDLTRLVNPADVLRWSSHRSFLLELEERGAPLVPTAWTATGDTVDLSRLLAARGWAEATLVPAVGQRATRAVRVGADGPDAVEAQRHLDVLLATGDVLIRAAASAPSPGVAAVVIGGQVSHLMGGGDETAATTTQEQTIDGQEAAGLARWVVDALGTPLAFARVDLVPDEVGTLQVVDVAASDAPLGLAVAGDGLSRLARAILHGT